MRQREWKKSKAVDTRQVNSGMPLFSQVRDELKECTIKHFRVKRTQFLSSADVVRSSPQTYLFNSAEGHKDTATASD